MRPEAIKSFTVEHLPERFELVFIVSTVGKTEVVKDIGIATRSRVYTHPKALINGKPYNCGSKRVFTKKSFDKMFDKFRKAIVK